MKNILAGLLVISGFSIIYFSISKNLLDEENLSSLATPEIILSSAINQDLLELKNKGELPSQWNSLKSIKMNTEMLGSSNLNPKLSVSTKADGKFSLECVILNENPSSKDGRYLVKFSIYDIKNNNQLWEKFRLYNRTMK